MGAFSSDRTVRDPGLATPVDNTGFTFNTGTLHPLGFWTHHTKEYLNQRAAEYLGTTQIVTVDTPAGEIKARIGADQPARRGDKVGLEFNGRTVTLFSRETGKALRSAMNEGVFHG